MDGFYTYPTGDADSAEQNITNQQQQVQENLPATGPRRQIKREKIFPAESGPISSRSMSSFTATEPADQQLVLPVREKQSLQTDWLVIVLFAGIALFATIRYSYIKYIRHLFMSLVNYTTSLRLLQENNYPASHGAYRLDVIFYLSFSIFIFQILNFFDLAHASKGIVYFGMVLGGVLLYFFVKKMLYLVVGSLFRTGAETSEFVFNADNFNRSLGIVLLPLVALVSFSPAESPVYIVFAGISVVLIFYIILLQRGALILLRKQFSILYLFLYLCTLEFLPLLLIYKVVVVE